MVYTEGAALQERSETYMRHTLEACQVTKEWDRPQSPHEFPEGGLAAWATTFGA
jgi:hypothetical protein